MATSFEFGTFGAMSPEGNGVDAMVFATVVSEVVAEDTSDKKTTAAAPVTNRSACRVTSSTACYIAFGPTASATAKTVAKRMYLPANTPVVVIVNPNDVGAVSTT